MFCNMCVSVMFSSRINKSTLIQQGSYNHFLFLTESGSASLWILSRACPGPRGAIVSMWWWISWKNILTSSLLLLHTQQLRWQRSSSGRFSDYMVCLRTLWVTGTTTSWVTSGRRYSGCVALSLHLAPVITHRLMVKQRLWTNGWKGIWGIMWQINNELGSYGYISMSIATILHTIWLYKWHPSWHFMAMRYLVS